ncbi:MAG: ATP-binding protein, partial [Pseudomonadota bacterium]
MDFIGRKTELSTLKSLVQKPKGQLAVIRGRRRIGKSRLAEEVGKNFTFMKFSGIAPTLNVTPQDQRAVFARQLSRYLKLPEMVFHDWDDIFTFLANQLGSEPTVLLLDEISWMGDKDPTFIGKLKNWWDMQLQAFPHLIVILCGSFSTWIEENIIK